MAVGCLVISRRGTEFKLSSVCLKKMVQSFIEGSRAGPSYKQVKHLLEAPKKLKKFIAKKCPKFKKKKKILIGPNLKEFWNKEKRKKKKKNC